MPVVMSTYGIADFLLSAGRRNMIRAVLVIGIGGKCFLKSKELCSMYMIDTEHLYISGFIEGMEK